MHHGFAVTALASFLETYTALELGLAAMAAVGLPAMSWWLGARLTAQPLDQRRLLARYWSTMSRGWLIGALVILAWIIGDRSFRELGLDWPIGAPGLIGLGLATALTVVMIVNVARFNPAPDKFGKLKAELDAFRLAPRNAAEFAAFVPVAITAGVWEELFYRGFLMWFLAPHFGVWGAIFISSALFGAGHAYQGVRGVFRTALAGAIFATAYAATYSLWWLMLLHAAVDLHAGLLSWRVYARHARKN